MTSTGGSDTPHREVTLNTHEQYASKHHRSLDSYGTEDAERILSSYLKILYVNHPFVRLFQTYINKFTISKTDNWYFYERKGREIVNKYRHNRTEDNLTDLKKNPTFEEFTKYLLDSGPSSYSTDANWQRFSNLCHPCSIQYDVIGKHETFSQDANHILRLLSDSPGVGPSVYGEGDYNGENVIPDDFKHISSGDIHRLWDLYYLDFIMFDF
jgi:chondroitin 4-sulfotransferase 11